ncbi:PutA protein [Pontibacter diazotrophicus]|uniref:PutA protein n=1 Tax=Pontibacter diazotrophicus TaxID=1400979 RepID=A0A3D8L6L2_9BACT|nr:proline dehydrogenase family protein [Pontibacter diazotrophicus]RDV13045.1 PutA protein [Pontibacter diazotrophicus]
MNNTFILRCVRHFNPENLQVAFRTKKDSDLRLAHWLFRLMGNTTLTRLGGAATREWVRLGLPFKALFTNSVYRHFCGGETVQEAQQAIEKLKAARVQTVLDHAARVTETEEGFEKVQEEVLRNIALASQTRSFSLISIKLTGIGYKDIFRKLAAGTTLTPEEQSALARTEKRLDTICQAAAEANVTVYFDAEESWLQPPIDALAEKMMLRYNKQRAVVFNTLQMYRTDRLNYLSNLLQRLESQEVMAGIKLVRGAYLEKEQERARKHGYASPVFSNKVDTDHSYNSAIDICLDHLKHAAFCAATHNEYSTHYLTRRIRKGELNRFRERIHFSQFYGMSDNLTFNLADAGYNTSKYLPYGDVATAVPYLIRRAEDNPSIAGQMNRELKLLEREMRRRKLSEA